MQLNGFATRWQHYANQNKCILISNKTDINSKRRHRINHVITIQMQHTRTLNTYTNCSEFCFVFSSFFRSQAIFKAMVTQCMTLARHCPKALPVNMKMIFQFCFNLFRFHFCFVVSNPLWCQIHSKLNSACLSSSFHLLCSLSRCSVAESYESVMPAIRLLCRCRLSFIVTKVTEF